MKQGIHLLWVGLVFILLMVLGSVPVWAGYVDNGDGTISDTRTGLMWQQGDEQNGSGRTWEEALAYCEGLHLAGHDDWRLPNVRELASLVDDSRYHPAIDTRYFPGCHSAWYCSSSSYAYHSYYPWYVDFYYGNVYWDDKYQHNDVRCVRAGPGSLGPLTIAQSPMSGPPGTTFTQWGTGLTPGGTATLHFKKPDGAEYPSQSQPLDGIGHFEITYTAPLDKPPGTYTWWAIDDATGRKSNEVSYVIEGEAGVIDHFVFSHIDDQVAGSAFNITITAVDYTGAKVTDFNDEVELDVTISGVRINPTKVSLSGGERQFQASIDKALHDGAIRARGAGKSGQSNRFDVTGGSSYGQVDALVLDGDNDRLPRENATVILRDNDGTEIGHETTNRNGYCSISHIPAGNYSIHAEYENRTSCTVELSVTGDAVCWIRELVLRSHKRPVILVPGIMGTDTNGVPYSRYPILPHAEPALQDLLRLHNPGNAAGWDTLKKKLNDHYQTFDCPYDWRFDLAEAQDLYLKRKIDQAKLATGWDKVDVVAHSMGGLLARAYIQSEDYDHDIDKFVMVGTPNHGSPVAYYLWEGGDPILADEIQGNTGFFDLGHYFYTSVCDRIHFAMKGYPMFKWNRNWLNPNAAYPEMILSKKSARRFFEDKVPALRQLMATYPCLYGGESSTIENSRNKNEWLIRKNNEAADKLLSHGIKMRIFGSEEEKTVVALHVKPSDSSGLYEDGEPDGEPARPDFSGDGTVPWDESAKLDGVVSVSDLNGGSHSGLIKHFAEMIMMYLDEGRDFSAEEAAESVSVSKGRVPDDEEPQWGVGVRFIGLAGVYLQDPEGKRCGVDDDAATSYHEPDSCTAVRDPEAGGMSIDQGPEGIYRIHLSGDVAEEMILYITVADGDQSAEETVDLFYPGTPVEYAFRFTRGGDPMLELLPEIEAPKNLETIWDDTTKLTWNGVSNPNLAGYRVYSRKEDEPKMSMIAELGSDTTQYQTGDPWADPHRFYAVSSFDNAGHESPLSEVVDNLYHLVARIGASTQEGVAPLTVQLVDESDRDISERRWDLGDGTTDNAARVSHIYNIPGTYIVKLRIIVGTLYGYISDETSMVIKVFPSSEQMKRVDSQSLQMNHDWQTIAVGDVFYDPVVIVGPPTYQGSDPGVVRVRNVGGTGFDVRFQEWAYLDGWHTTEKYPYLVLEKGRRTMDDGSIWEAGTFALDGTGKWGAVNFAEAFPGQPALFLTLQTFNGSDPVTVRAKNVTATGFETALFEEEAKMDGHVTETVGYLAVYNPQGWGMVDVNGTSIPYLLQTVTAGNVFTPVLGYSLKVEEEKSKDTEVDHMDETVSVMVLGDKVFAQDVSTNGSDPCALRLIRPEYGAALEWGTVDGVNHQWLRVPLAKHFTHPVVVAKPVSYRGADPGVIRIGNVDGDRFDVKFQEWLCKDGWHTTERVFYLVAEEGTQNLAGLTVEAGALDTKLLQNEGWESVGFSAPFSETPALFASLMTYNGSDPTITRTKNVTASGFDVTMDEEEAKRDGHVSETLGWIAIDKGSGATSDNRKVKVFSSAADSSASKTEFGQAFNRRFPVLIGDVSTTNGGDPCVLRYKNLSPSAVEFLLQEENSKDTETNHVNEGLSVFVAE